MFRNCKPPGFILRSRPWSSFFSSGGERSGLHGHKCQVVKLEIRSWGWGGDRDTDRASEGRSSLPEVWPCRLWSLKKTEGFASLHTIFDTSSNSDTFHLYSLFQILLRALRTKNWKPWRRDPRDGLPPPANHSHWKTNLTGSNSGPPAIRGLCGAWRGRICTQQQRRDRQFTM